MKEEFDPQCWPDFWSQGRNNYIVFGDLMISENNQGNPLLGVLFVIVSTTVVFEWFPFTKWPFNKGQDNRNSSSGRLWPLNRGQNYSN